MSRSAAITAGVLLLTAGCSSEIRQRAAATSSSARSAVDVGASLRRGQTKTLYAVEGRSSRIGRFVVTCSSSGQPRSAYVVTGADTLVAVEGRGASRAARVLPGKRLAGGARPGLERWVLSEGTEAEEVSADLSLTAFTGRLFGNGCEFELRGSTKLLSR
jgi:hypothetical protein